MFDTLLKKNNCEIFTSRTKITESSLDSNAYIKSLQEQGYGIRALRQNRLGYASSNIFEKDSAKKTLKSSLDSSKHSEKLPGAFSFTSENKVTRVSSNNDARIRKDPVAIACELREECCRIAQEKKVTVTNGRIKLAEFEYTIENSLGIEKKEHGTYITAALETKPDTKKPVSELSSVYAKRLYDKDDFLCWLKKRLEMTGMFVEPGKIRSGSYDILLSPAVTAPLLLATIGYWSSAKSRVDGISLFEGKKGAPVATENFSATDDPTFPDAPSTFGMDMEGTATKKRDVIKDGIFSGYLYDNKYSTYFAESSTGNAKKSTHMGPEYIYQNPPYCSMHNLVISEGTETRDSILDDMKGIFIETAGIPSADPETGNFGFELRNAFIVSHGEMKPVRYGIYSGKVQDLLKNISALSKDRSAIPSSMAPEFSSACICPDFFLEKEKISGS